MNNICRFISLLSLFFLIHLGLHAQELNIKQVLHVPNDLTSSKRDLKDAEGKVCPAVLVQLSIEDDISFREAVKVESRTGGYTVFVPAYTKLLTVLKADSILCEVQFSQWNITQLEPNNTYSVDFSISLDLDKIFRVEPASAKVEVNGINVPLDKNGMGVFPCEVNQMYNYTISAPGYESFSDAFMILPEDERVDPINIFLEKETVPVRFYCNAKEFEVLLDNESWGLVSNGEEIDLPLGSWNLRMVADGYEEQIRKVSITKETSLISVALESSNQVSNKLRPRTSLFVSGGVGFPFEQRKNMSEENVITSPIRIGLDVDFFVGRFFTLRPGIEFMALLGEEVKLDEDTPYSVNIFGLANFNVPLGKFNRHHLSIGIGPLLGIAGKLKNDDNTSSGVNEMLSESSSMDDEFSKFLYGGRIEARITINHIVFGMNIDYMRCRYSIGDKGLIAPMVNLGYKF